MVLKTDMPHILAVDDDDRIRGLLAQYLTKNAFMVVTAADAEEARAALRHFSFDLCVLDIMMPGEDGLSLAKYIQKSYDYPVLLLTAMTESRDRIAGLEAGADDYLPKPFEPKELLLRIEAILRRTLKASPQNNGKNDTILHLDGGQYDCQKQVFLNLEGQEIKLTDGDKAILNILSQKPNMPVKREMIAAAMQLESNDRAVDVAITRLRKKIEDDPAEPKIIMTLRGKGYMLKVLDDV